MKLEMLLVSNFEVREKHLSSKGIFCFLNIFANVSFTPSKMERDYLIISNKVGI